MPGSIFAIFCGVSRKPTTGLNGSGDRYSKLTIKFAAPEKSDVIPSAYKFWGQHCYLDVPEDGKSVSIVKTACKAICLDKNIEGTSNDNSDELVLSLK
jgi:hypothetical protein